VAAPLAVPTIAPIPEPPRGRTLSTPAAALLILLLSAFAAIPLAQPYLFASDDGHHHLFRLWELDQLVRSGTLYSRWAPDFFYGYGYPLFLYISPLPYYPGVALHALGLGYIDSLKLLFWLALALSGLSMYAFSRQHFGQSGSVLASVLYMYAPYHLLDIYLRGALPELLAFVWFPLVLWAVRGLLRDGSPIYVPLTGLTYGALILTHNISAYLLTLALVPYCAFLWAGRQRSDWIIARDLVASLVLGLSLSAFYALPALLEQDLVHFERLTGDIESHVFPWQTLVSSSPVHDYGIPLWRPIDLPGIRLGLVQGLLLLAGGAVLFARRREVSPLLWREGLWGLLLCGMGLYLMQPSALWFWESFPLAKLVQFPWRLLALLAIPSALLGALLVERLARGLRLPVHCILVALVIFSSLYGLRIINSTLTEDQITRRGHWEYELGYNAIGTSSNREYLPVGVTEDPVPPIADPAALLADSPAAYYRADPSVRAVDLIEDRGIDSRYLVRAESPSTITLNHVFFPGWSARVDGQQEEVAASVPEGLVSLSLPAGEHQIELRFEETPLRAAADLVSLLALAALFGLLIRSRRPTAARAVAAPAAAPARTHGRLPAAVLALALALAWWLYPTPLWADLADGGLFAHEVDHRLRLRTLAVQADGLVTEPLVRAPAGASFRVTLGVRASPGAGFSADETLFLCLTDRRWVHACATRRIGDLLEPDSSVEITTALEVPQPAGLASGAYRLETGVYSNSLQRRLSTTRRLTVPIVRSEPVGLSRPIFIVRTPGDEKASEGLGYQDIQSGSVPTEAGGAVGGPFYVPTDSRERGLFRLPDSPDGDPRSVAAADNLFFDLLWRLGTAPFREYRAGARLRDAQGDTYAYVTRLPLAVREALSFRYEPGDLVRQRISLYVPYETPPSEYTLEVALFASGERLETVAATGTPAAGWIPIDRVRVHPSAIVPGRPAEQVAAARPVALTDEIGIFDFQMAQDPLRPGDTLSLDILWQANAGITRDFRARFELVDAQGTVRQEALSPVGGTGYPTSQWRSEEVIRGQYRLGIPLDAPSGQATVWLSLLSPESPAPVARASLGTVEIRARPRRLEPPEIAQPRSAAIPSVATLLGYNLLVAPPAAQQPGSTAATVVLVWRAAGPTAGSLKVSLQLLDSDGRLLSQHDSLPQGGQAPTTSWQPGEIIEDPHALTVPATTPASGRRLIVVVYDEASGQRLRFADGRDHADIGTLSAGE